MSAADSNVKRNLLAHAVNDLAFEFLKKSSDEKNVFVSPLSISTALAVVYQGSDGSTSEVMREVLKFDKYGLKDQDVHDHFRSLLTSVKQNATDYQLSSYTGVLVQKDFTILDSYKHSLKQNYSAQLDIVDFIHHGDEAKDKVNAIVNNETKGKIKTLLDEPPKENTKLVLLNAVYFFGAWGNAFERDRTLEQPFYNNGVQEKMIPMMNREGSYNTGSCEELGASLVVIPYKGENLASMIIVLPHSRTGAADLQKKITSTFLANAVKNTEFTKIILSIPKFSLEYSVDLVKPLSDMGLGQLFSDEANFSRIAGEQAELAVTSAVHKAVIDVNEDGCEAAAATGFQCGIVCLSPEFTVNHPFLFFIQENQTGLILFSGRVDEL